MSLSNILVPNNYSLFCQSVNFGDGVSTAFEKYVQSAYVSNISGPFAAPLPSGGLFRQLDRTYVISVSGMTGTFSSANHITFSTPIVPNMWADMYFPIYVTDGSNGTVPGTAKIAFGTGIMTIYVGFAGNFTGTGTCGFPGFNITFASFIS